MWPHHIKSMDEHDLKPFNVVYLVANEETNVE